jgi:MFS family permease
MANITDQILSPQSSLPQDQNAPRKPLPSLGFLISVCLDIFKKQIPHFFLYALVIWIPFLILIFTTFPEYFAETSAQSTKFHPISILTVVFSLFYTIGIILMTKKAVENEKILIGGILSEGIERFLPAIIVIVLYVISVTAGAFLLLIPGIYLAYLFLFSVVSSVLNKKSHIHALSYSRDLIKGYWWSVFWKMIGFGIVFSLGVVITIFFIGFITGILLSIVGLEDAINSPVFSAFFFFIAQFLGGIFPIFLTLLFLYLEQIKNPPPAKPEEISQKTGDINPI